MTKDEALKLALEAFEWNYNTDLDNIPACEQWAKMLKENITAIREALAQPEQEPVAWPVGWVDDGGTVFWKDKPPADGADLYTAPPQRTWVGLTGFEQKELMAMSARDAVFATEAKLKEKNI